MNSGVITNQYIPQANMSSMGQNYQYPPMEVNSSQQTKNARLNEFWSNVMIEINSAKGNGDRHHDLPMARIKKIMKMDESVQACMIGSEAPVVIAKACELFIRELTLQAWINTEDNKRRTLQKVDITTAVSSNEMYDFLIDIIPRDDQNVEYGRGENKLPPYDPMMYLYNNPNQLMEGQLGAISNVNPNISSYLPGNQPASYQQGMSTLMSQNQNTNYNQNVSQSTNYNQTVTQSTNYNQNVNQTTSYNQNVHQSIPQPIPQSMQQSIQQPMPQPISQQLQQPIPQTNSYLYVDSMSQVQNPAVVQGTAMMNSQLLGIVSSF